MCSNSKLVILDERHPRNLSKKSSKPFWSVTLSCWSKSPVTTNRLPSPIRVKSIFICDTVEFCISSATIQQFLKVRPRIYPKGAISMTFSSSNSDTSLGCINWYNTSYIGRTHGAILSSNVPGRNPKSSSTETEGRVKISFSHRPSKKFLTPNSVANMVLPVPAGPVANMIFLAFDRNIET